MNSIRRMAGLLVMLVLLLSNLSNVVYVSEAQITTVTTTSTITSTVTSYTTVTSSTVTRTVTGTSTTYTTSTTTVDVTSTHTSTQTVATTVTRTTTTTITEQQTQDTTPPTVRVIAPNGGERLSPGSVFRIRWEAWDNVGVTGLYIRLYQDGVMRMFIADNPPNTGYYDWTVPNRPGSNYKIVVIARDAAGNFGEDASDGTFEIVAVAQGTLQHFDLDYRGTPLNSDGNDQTMVTASPCSSLTLFFYYREVNTGNPYIIRVYPEWDKDRFIANSDNNEAAPEGERSREEGGFRWDVETYTVPCTPGTYKVRVVYRGSHTPPTWDSYDRLLAEGTVIVQAAATAILQVGIRHTFIGDLKIWVGVEGGREVLIWNREGGNARNIFREWNLLQLGFTTNDLPPSESKRWYLKISDEVDWDEGRLEYFRIVYQGQTYESQDHPEIKDRKTVWAWIPSRGVPSLPDLTVRDVSFSPQTVNRGESITVSWTEVNIGSGNAGPYRVGIYLGVSEYGRDYFLGSFNRDGLAAGDSRSYTRTLIIPSIVLPGSYYVTVFIDDLTLISESDEENNIGSSTPNRLQIQTPREEFRLRKSLIYVLDPFELSEGSSRSFVFRKPPIFINLEDFLVDTVRVIILVHGLEPGEVIIGRVAVWVVNWHREATFRAVGSESTRDLSIIRLYLDARGLASPNSLNRIELDLASERGNVIINQVLIIVEGSFIARGPY
jgi:hypothetical protein